MTAGQVADLKRIYGADVEVSTHSEQVANAAKVVELGAEFDVLAVVLPPVILTDLVNPRVNQKPVIRAVANRVATGNTVLNPATGKEETEFRFEHSAWERVLKIEVVTERL
jgi:hypothetical protein